MSDRRDEDLYGDDPYGEEHRYEPDREPYEDEHGGDEAGLTGELSYTQEFSQLVDEGWEEPRPEVEPAHEPEARTEPEAQPEPEPEPEPAPEPEREYVEQPTEEVFALEAKLLNEEEIPELDPILRAALLEDASGGGHGGEGGGRGTGGGDGEPDEERPEEDEPRPEDEPAEAEAQDAEHEHQEPPSEAGQEPYTEEHGVTGTYERDAYDPITERTAVLGAEARREVHAALQQAREQGIPWDPSRPPTGGDSEPPGPRRHYWWRFMLAATLIVLAFGGATYAAGTLGINSITKPLGGATKIPGLNTVPPSEGGARTIVVLGSDVRKGDTDAGRSDTTMLLRLDPDRHLISMLSIPRDLEVDIPGYGTDKFNAAYSYGGAKLTLETIKALTGLQINHVINVDFQGFAEAVDAIDCVFVDVDRDYFNDNSGLDYSEQYATIDIDAGYQKLCGPDALDYVRYRHTDTDLVRSARQQDFLREARLRVPSSELWSKRNDLIQILADYTKTDPRFTEKDNLLDMVKVMYELRGAEVNKVEFPATLGPSYVYSTPEQIHQAVTEFLGYDPDQADSDTVTGQVPGEAVQGAEQKQRKQQAANEAKERQKAKQQDKQRHKVPSTEDDGLVDASIGGRDVAEQLAGETGPSFPVFYPKRLPSGTIYSEGTRMYHLRDTDKNPHAAYRIVLLLSLSDGDHWFGVQGLRGWNDPPILSAPHEDYEWGGRTYSVYYQGDSVRLISWESDGNTYWISNSLGQTLTNDQMIAMARSVDSVAPDPKPRRRAGGM